MAHSPKVLICDAPAAPRSAAIIVAEGYHRQRGEIDRLRETLQAIADEAVKHHEHNPESGKDRLPAGYRTILNLATAAL